MALAREGAAIVVNDLGGSRDGSGAGGQRMADAVVDEIRAARRRGCRQLRLGRQRRGRSATSCRPALDAFGQVDICVNNAGILRDKSFANTSEEMWDIVVQVHLKGTYCVTHAVYNHMKERGRGRGDHQHQFDLRA